MKTLQITTVITTSLGFLGVLLAANGDLRAAYLILAAAVSYIVEEIVARRGTDEFSNRLGSMAALVAFGIAPSMLVLDALMSVTPFLMILPIIYLLATAVWLTRYDLSRRLAGLPSVANGFVIPVLFILEYTSLPILVGWLVLASGLMAFDISLSGRKTQKEYVVQEKEEKKDVPNGFIPLSDL